MDELNLDQEFLTRFSCMGTQDKDVLISQLHGLLESQLSRDGCAFFLDMTNWNLQAAVGAFYDHYSSDGGVLPGVTLVRRVGQGGQPAAASLNLPPNTVFTETWTLRNTGNIIWPLGVHLTLKGGGELCSLRHMHLPSLSPGQETTVTMEMKTPPASGVYHCHWRVAMPGGALFGEPVWLMVHVQDEMVSGLVQQLSSFSTGDDKGGGRGEMEVTQCRTDEARQDHGAALNPFGNTLGTGIFQDQVFGSGSMMSSPHSIPTSIDQLLLPIPPSTTQFSPRPIPNSITANSITTTTYQNIGSNLSHLAVGPDQTPSLEHSSSSMQQDMQTISSSAPGMEDSTEHS